MDDATIRAWVENHEILLYVIAFFLFAFVVSFGMRNR